MAIVILAILGLACGSFVNVLVWRLHEQETPKTVNGKRKTEDLSILKGRSVCPNCRHQLSGLDLVPIVSWLALKGHCRYCKNPISVQYPIVETAMGLVFVLSYIFWPSTPHLSGQWLLLATWLTASVGLMALAVYDTRWMLLPNKIIYPTLLAAVAGRTAYIAAFDNRPGHSLWLWALSVAVASGIFYILYMVSGGRWIGFGDVRLGLITGTLLATPARSLLMIFLASLIGTLMVVPAMARGNKNMGSRLPYGPFLILATAIIVVFGASILDWYQRVMGIS